MSTSNRFTDQKPRIATEEETKASWGGEKNGKKFRCYLCGYQFKVGDQWRFVFATHTGFINFKVCKDCDGDDVLIRWIAANEELKTRFWWAT